MINTDCQFCVDEGRHCIAVTVPFEDGKRLAGFVHYRIIIEAEHYKDETKQLDMSDMILAKATGMSDSISFRVDKDDKHLMPVYEE